MDPAVGMPMFEWRREYKWQLNAKSFDNYKNPFFCLETGMISWAWTFMDDFHVDDCSNTLASGYLNSRPLVILCFMDAS